MQIVRAGITATGIPIGTKITGGAANRILYADASQNLAEDTELAYQGTTHRIALGGNGSTFFAARMTIWGDDASDDIFQLLGQPTGARSGLSSVNGWQINSLGIPYHYSLNGSTDGFDIQEDSTAGREGLHLVRFLGSEANRTVPLFIVRLGPTPAPGGHALSYTTFAGTQLAHVDSAGNHFSPGFDSESTTLNLGVTNATTINVGSNAASRTVSQNFGGAFTANGNQNAGVTQGALTFTSFATASMSITNGLDLLSNNHYIKMNAGALFGTGIQQLINGVVKYSLGDTANEAYYVNGVKVAFGLLHPTDTVSIKSHAAFSGSERNIHTDAVTTNNATPTTIASFAIADNTAVKFKCSVNARNPNSHTDWATWDFIGVLSRESGGAATLTGVIQYGGAAYAGAPEIFSSVAAGTLLANITNSGTNAIVQVTGIAATTYNWDCTIEYQGISGSA